MTDTAPYPEDDEISLLDLLQTVAENLRLLVMGPIVVGLVALAGASFWPKTYESTAVLRADQTTASLMLSAAVLDPIAASLGYTAQLQQDAARDKLKSQIKVNANAKDKLLTLTTQADSPQAAQALAKAVLQQTYAQSQPRDSAKLRLQKQLTQAQTREKESTQAAAMLAGKMEKVGGELSFQLAQGYSQMIGIVKESQTTQLDMEAALKGLDDSALVQEATLPTKHITPKRGIVTLMAALAAGFALLLFVFIRQALRNASQDAEAAQKLSAIKAAWQKALGKAG